MVVTLERRAAHLFSTAVFRPVLERGADSRIEAIIGDLRSSLGLADHSNGAVIDAAYHILERNYRNEYVYKNLIASKLYVGRHRAANAALLHEFRIGTSVADVILVNGAATVYEIKTELDSPAKLRGQVDDYFRAFTKVNLVVHERNLDRFALSAAELPVGIIKVGQRMRLSVEREAPVHDVRLDVRPMFDALRVAEIKVLLAEHGVAVPQVPNGLRYGAWLELALEIPALDFHDSFSKALKRRAPAGRIDALSDPNLRPLWSILVQLNPNPAQEDRFLKWLKQTGG